MSWLKGLVGKNRWEVAATLAILLIDGVHSRLFEPLNQLLRQVLKGPRWPATALVVGSYLAFLAGLYLVGRLQPTKALEPVTSTDMDGLGRKRTLTTTWPKLLLFYPSLGFALIVIMATLSVGGLMQSATDAPGIAPPSDTVMAWLVTGMVVLLGVHAGLVVADLKPRYESGTPGYLAVLVPVVLVNEVVLNLSTAYWHRFLGLDAASKAIANPDLRASFLVAAPLYVIFFAAPRFTFLSRSFSWVSLASGLALTLDACWKLVSRAPLF